MLDTLLVALVISVDTAQVKEFPSFTQYEDALIQPPREVLDIHMGNYASGGR